MTAIGNPSLLRYQRARKGIPPSKVAGIKRRLNASDERMASITGVSRKTYRTHEANRSFTPDEAERMLRVEEILDAVEALLGDSALVQDWLLQPNRSLGGAIPFDLLSSPSGAEAVQDVLKRLQHGIYA